MSTRFATNTLILSGQVITADADNLYLNGETISGGGAGSSVVSATGSVIGGVSGLILSNRHYTVDFLGVAYQTGSVGANTIFRTINRTLGSSVNVIMQHTGITSGWNFAFPSGTSSGFTWLGAQPVGIGSGRKGVISLTCMGTASNQIIASYAEQLVQYT